MDGFLKFRYSAVEHITGILHESAADAHAIGSFLLRHCANLRKVRTSPLRQTRQSRRDRSGRHIEHFCGGSLRNPILQICRMGWIAAL